MRRKTMGSNGKITLPRDAEGRELPLDTKVLYDKDGRLRKVDSLTFRPNSGWWDVVFTDSYAHFSPNSLRLTPLDSWEKLLDDLDNASKGGDNAECLYMRRDGMEMQCPGCRLEDNESDDIECSYLAYADIAARIRKLMGDE